MKSKTDYYKNIIFDSDGVVLNSNLIKLDAFCELGRLVIGDHVMKKIRFHVLNNKHLTRYGIFDYIMGLRSHEKSDQQFSLPELAGMFTNIVFDKLCDCEIDRHLPVMRTAFASSTWFVLTLGDEVETRHIYHHRDLCKYFDGGIYGAPNSKSANLDLLQAMHSSLLALPTLFVGDSISDAIVAEQHGLDFALLTHWSTCDKAFDYCYSKGLLICTDMAELARRLLQSEYP